MTPVPWHEPAASRVARCRGNVATRRSDVPNPLRSGVRRSSHREALAHHRDAKARRSTRRAGGPDRNRTYRAFELRNFEWQTTPAATPHASARPCPTFGTGHPMQGVRIALCYGKMPQFPLGHGGPAMARAAAQAPDSSEALRAQSSCSAAPYRGRCCCQRDGLKWSTESEELASASSQSRGRPTIGRGRRLARRQRTDARVSLSGFGRCSPVSDVDAHQLGGVCIAASRASTSSSPREQRLGLHSARLGQTSVVCHADYEGPVAFSTLANDARSACRIRSVLAWVSTPAISLSAFPS